MRVTVCELPHQPAELARAWPALCAHTAREHAELVLLPEFAFCEPVWESDAFDAARWATAERTSDGWLQRYTELQCAHVVGARPVTIDGRPYNEGFVWSRERGSVEPLRRKFHLPDLPGGREVRWFTRGDAAFPRFAAGELAFGLNICTELWALDTYAAYALGDIAAILSPRATAAATTSKWLSIGTVAAVRSGAYSVSSNRVSADGAYGGVGWVIGPDGERLAATSRDEPFATVDIDPATAAAARHTYPRDVFSGRR